MVVNDKKTRYSDEELAMFEKIIDQKLLTSKEQLEYYLSQLRGTGDDTDAKVRGLDDGIISRENQITQNMAARQKKYIQHLENAKLRVMNKVYGVCRQTGKLISKERLKAVPHATLSIEAKQSKFK